MLTKFIVRGFRGFQDPLTLDLESTKNYEFNAECLHDSVIRNAVIYGVNGCGKSNLGLAIVDLTHHLHEHAKANEALATNYLNGDLSEDEVAEFAYHFQFNEHQIQYQYGKHKYQETIYEKFWIDGQLVIDFDKKAQRLEFCFGDGDFIEGYANALKEKLNDIPSVVKMLRMLLLLKKTPHSALLQAFLKFVDGMISIRTLTQHADFSGLQNINDNLVSDLIIKNNRLEDFQDFLKEAGIDCQLGQRAASNGQEQLVFKYDHKAIKFQQAASTGTLSLGVLYYWLMQFEKQAVSFVYLDEFDAYYHHELAIAIVRRLKKLNQQVILTTHNTTIMSNDLLRPDCYFIFEKSQLQPLHHLIAKKELRKAHNLEKIYKGLTDGLHNNQ